MTFAADWPTYMRDNTRVGRGDDQLKMPLVQQWVYKAAAAPQRAWPDPLKKVIEGREQRQRVTYDGVFHVAVVGERVYFGSSVDHTMYCVNAATGAIVWRFVSDGPIRLAPTVSDDHVYFGSDDGVAYCLSAKDGSVTWKMRAGPRDERILARGRMISRWPVRTGVLVDDGVAFFGAGIFPHEAVYLYAVEAKSGKVIWKNDAISEADAGRNDLTPQGYLLASKDFLFVPSGRTLPAAFDRKTGQMNHKRRHSWRRDAGGQVGGSNAMLADNQIYSVGEHHILAMDQGRGGVGFGWFKGRCMTLDGGMAFMANGKEIIAVDRRTHAEATRERHRLEITVEGLNRELRRKKKTAKDYAPKMAKLKAARDGIKKLNSVGVKWRVDSPLESTIIVSGNTVVAGGDGQVVALDSKNGSVKFDAKIDGEVRGLAAAGGRLYVSTSKGMIHCFGSAEAPKLATTPKAGPFAFDDVAAKYAKAAEEIVKHTGVKSGFCLVVGNAQGQLAYELAQRTDLRIHCVDTDAKKVADARQRLANTGLYGNRITIDHVADSIPYSNYFANLVVSDTGGGALLKNAVRHVKPCGGVICLKQDVNLPEEFDRKTIDGWTVATRGKLPGASDWTHQYGNPAATSAVQDTRVKGGLSVLWYGDPGPGKMQNRHVGAVGPVSANGRLFVQGDESIMAYDAYNGQFLWEHKNPGAVRTGVFNNFESGNMVASNDSLYMLIGPKCIRYDGATGQVKNTYAIPNPKKEKDRAWGFIAHKDGVLFGTSTIRKPIRSGRGRVFSNATDMIFAFDVDSGERLWTYQGKSITHTTIAIGDGRVFFIDSSITSEQREALLKEDKTELKKLKGEARRIAEARQKKFDVRLAVAIDSRKGDVMWSKPTDVTDCSGIGIGAGQLTLMYRDNHVVVCGANANGHYWNQFLNGDFKRRRLVALSAADGYKLWSKDANYRHRPIIIDDKIVAEPWAFDLETGKQLTRTHPITGEQTPWKFIRPGHHCGAISATSNMMFFRSGFTAYYDLDADSGTRHFAGHRTGCWINMIPANGLLMVPESSAGCNCLFSIASTVVFEPRGDRQVWGVYTAEGAKTPVQHLALNFGAPGDRRDAKGKLWLGYPRPSSRAGLDLPLNLGQKFGLGGGFYYNGDGTAKAAEDSDVAPWINTSGARGVTSFVLPLIDKGQAASKYTVRLYAAPGSLFDVKMQGKVAVKDAAGGLIECTGVKVKDRLNVEVVRKKGTPVVNGIEVLRSGSKEIVE